ncbi:ATP-NAD kinase family protein [Leucobacter luti]|uniref:ATP-NAD kinase family protein n=1 Tax=Leucobacter luti TaxID=340320 RepID=UPI003CFFDF86
MVGSPGVVGLVVNPLAGIGGEVGLGGSDGDAVQAAAAAAGGIPRAPERAERFVRELARLAPSAAVLRDPAGSADETAALARSYAERGVDILVFVGGDGTARDVLRGLGSGAGSGAPAGAGARQLCLGVPAGVKMHSGVFAVTPEDAAQQVAEVLAGRAGRARTVERDVVDLDEEARREGVLSTSIYGTMLVPLHERMQRGKRSPAHGSGIDARGVAAEIRRQYPGHALLFGPGTTVARVSERLGVDEPTLLGFDAVLPGGSVHLALGGAELAALTRDRDFAVVLSPIGGQGFVIGRGNHQLTAEILGRLPRRNLVLVAEPAKLGELAGRLRIDAPTPALNDLFRGPARVILGEGEIAVARIE